MGYRGGAPSWVYKNQMSIQAASYEAQIERLNRRIKELEKENEELRRKLQALEE